MTNFTFPETYRAYLSDAAVRSAVEHILSSKKLEVPADLEWNRLPDFHAAVLAAHQVRSDYATALHCLWNKVWQPALDDCGFAGSLEPRSFIEQQEYSSYSGDTYSSWEGLLERVYDTGDHKVGLGVTTRLKQALLTIWILNRNDEDLTTSLTLGDDWDSELEEGYLYTRDNLAPVRDGCIQLVPLHRTAKRALEQIGSKLGVPRQR